MRTYKMCIRISFYLTLVSLVCLIATSSNVTLSSVFAGLFASTLFSLFISVCNYLTLRKYKIEMLVINSYRKSCDGYSSLFRTDKDISLEDAQTVVNVLNAKLYEIYIENHELLIGLFWFNKFKNEVKQLEKMVQNQIIDVTQIEYYIEYYQDEAKEKTRQIYHDLDVIIDDNSIYIESLKLCKICKGELRSFEEYDINDINKKKYANNYRNKIN